jgi:hypothetical protein
MPQNAVNGYGSTLMGIGFPSLVNMGGAYFAAQGAMVGSTTAVRVHGYLNGLPAGDSNWLMNISTTPQWLDMSVLTNVDRIVVESIPTYQGVAGYYGMDDLTYEPIPEPATMTLLCGSGLALLLARRRRPLNPRRSERPELYVTPLCLQFRRSR